MSLSRQEQRILAEIEQHLTWSDPGLSERLERFDPGYGRRPRPLDESPRTGKVWWLWVIVIYTAVALVIALAWNTPGHKPCAATTPAGCTTEEPGKPTDTAPPSPAGVPLPRSK